MSKLKFTTPLIDYTTDKEILNITSDELKKIGIDNLSLTGDSIKDAEKQKHVDTTIEENRDRIPKVTLDIILNRLFDSIKMPSNSAFEIYASTLKDIRTAKIKGDDTIEMSLTDLKKLKNLFTTPADAQLNRYCAFVVDCINEAIEPTAK